MAYDLQPYAGWRGCDCGVGEGNRFAAFSRSARPTGAGGLSGGLQGADRAALSGNGRRKSPVAFSAYFSGCPEEIAGSRIVLHGDLIDCPCRPSLIISTLFQRVAVCLICAPVPVASVSNFLYWNRLHANDFVPMVWPHPETALDMEPVIATP